MRKGTSARRVFDRALQALPLMQHGAIWDIYLSWTRDFGVTEVTIKIYKRYIMFDPSFREDYISYLEDEGQYEEAVRQLAICVDDEQFISRKDQSKYQLWMKICDISADHPKDAIRAINVEAVIRSGISRFSDEVGKLWCRLADFYIRQGQFEMARNIFEEGINSVVTVRDFTIIFDSYVKVEESIITEKMRQSKSSGNDDELTEGILDADDIEMRLARLEFLMEKRPLLVNSVVLRQNPHNVFEWHKRVKLNKASPKKMLLTFIEAVKTVDTKLATGKLSTIWLAFAKFYEKQKDFGNAREIYSQATQVNFKSVDELANIWCAWAEMEINNGGYKEALALLQQAVKEPASTIKRRKAQASAVGKGMTSEQFEGSMTSDKLYRNTKVWGFYLDVEESIGSTSSCRAAYDRAMELKIVTPNMALNYATYLENHHFYEGSFKVYEQSIALFAFPPVKIIWMKYLDKFIERYGGTKLERLRDLFEQSLKSLPSDDAPEFYIKYAKTEEKYGLERHAMAVYDRATRVVPEAKRIDLYRLYIKKVEIYFGITKTRPVYERAIQELGDEASRSICLEFAEMERKLGEIDRARLILQHGSQLADPRKEKAYWRFWKDFEETHGNEDTFRDMLRIQRSVEASFSQVKQYLASSIFCVLESQLIFVSFIFTA